MRLRGDDGASSVEYGLIVVAIAAVVVAVVVAFGSTVQALFSESCTSLNDQIHSAGSCPP